MGTSSNELDHPSSPKVSEHEMTTDGDLKASSPAAANELKAVTSSKSLNPSSSSLSHSPSPDSPIEHPQSTNTSSQTEGEGNENIDSINSEEKQETPNVEPDNSPQLKEDSNLDTGHRNDDHETPTAESPGSTFDVGTPGSEIPLFTLDSGDAKENHETSNADVPLSALSPELTESTLELGSSDPTTSPPTQVMERPSESKYRIPSSVFARSKSNAPDWSVASNESLFSIQMGNMSFIKDDFWKSGEIGLKSAELEMIKAGDLDMLRSGEYGMKSGELGMQSGEIGMTSGELNMGTGELETMPGEAVTPTEPSTSTQMFSYSQTPNIPTTSSGKSAELGVAVETMKEVIRECADHRSKNSIDGRVDGNSSTKSFAFSGPGADASLRIGSTAKSETGSLHNPLSRSQSRSVSRSQPKQEQEAKSPAAALDAAAKPGWFSWMSCVWCRPYCCL